MIKKKKGNIPQAIQSIQHVTQIPLYNGLSMASVSFSMQLLKFLLLNYSILHFDFKAYLIYQNAIGTDRKIGYPLVHSHQSQISVTATAGLDETKKPHTQAASPRWLAGASTCCLLGCALLASWNEQLSFTPSHSKFR